MNANKDATFDVMLTQYKQAIEEVETHQKKLDISQIITVLTSRDELQNWIENKKEMTSENIVQLSALDHQFKTFGPQIALSTDLKKLQSLLNKDTKYWWWTFKAPVDKWSQYDWVWTALTAGTLALSASFMVNIYSAIVAGNATVATALSTIAQAAGLVLLSGGAFTKNGQEKVKTVLSKLNVKPRFYAGSTFAISLFLLVVVYITNNSLDDVFLDYGNARYDQGYLTSAKLAYQQGIDIDPNNIEFHQNLGKVYESLGQLKQAFDEYLIGTEDGNADSLNDLGRVTINHSSPALAETYLLMGLQRAETNKKTSPYLYYQLNRNIGWALIKQKKYPKAIKYLEEAAIWRSKVEKYSKEGGMNNCFLAYAYEQEKEEKKSSINWGKCIKHSKPDYLHEYLWLISIGKNEIAYCVNTDKVLAGYGRKRPENINKQCDNLQ